MKRKIIIGIAAAVGLLIVAGVVLFFLAGRTSPSGIEDAIEDLRAENRAPRAPEPGLPTQGVYELSVIGSERISRGPVKVNRDLPTTAPMIVRHTDSGYETEVRYSTDHAEWVRYRLAGRGASATWGPVEDRRDRRVDHPSAKLGRPHL